MQTLFSRLGTSQQVKLPCSADNNLLVVSRKLVTPLPMITSTEKHPSTKKSDGGERHQRVTTDRRDSFKTDKSLSFEMGRRRKKNGTEATTVKVIFPDNQTESSINQEPCSSRRTSVSLFQGFVSGTTAEKRDRYSISVPKAAERSVVDSSWTLKSSSQVYGMDRELGQGQEGSHGNCSHPHVTRVDILFKPVAKDKSNDHREPINLNKPSEKRKRPVNRELTKQTEFGSKTSLFASTSTLPIRPAKQSSIPHLDTSTGSSESTLPIRPAKQSSNHHLDTITGSSESNNQSIRIAGEGTWDSNAYTAKNTRIEFAQSLHVPRPFFVKRKSNCWSTKQHETKRLCTRHLQHTRPVPRQLPSPLTNFDHGTNHPANPWSVKPAHCRFEPSRPSPVYCPKYTLMNITKLKQSRTVEPSHPHMNLAAINSVYNWNRLSFQGSLTPPVSEADSLDDLEDFETLNLRMQMDSLINRVKDLYAT